MYWLRRIRAAKVAVTATSTTTPAKVTETGDLDGPARLGRFDGLRSAVLVRALMRWRHSGTASLAEENWQVLLRRIGENTSLRQITTGPAYGMVQRDLRPELYRPGRRGRAGFLC